MYVEGWGKVCEELMGFDRGAAALLRLAALER